ncbi:SDR family NAD(P)-dependent oxidoreductase [Empedobacter stercoris]|uniref:SDR family NAD(P)-dependent oxidoreductase n=2 Tax=Empedobacter TaxID=59734 RepID=A0ABY8V691_9FLAO|nr:MULTISPECIES: SDR family NAD(P)-dependent oxidoreductase [Empedobacter]MCA4780739.1 SDR family NAD(P)-dependent oxidoreductase [Empedobacter stercoris]MCA4809320.1 SDR family NAD(P)-dependent oxidoreductase [Empedobacter stercoris]MDM1522954.1 SDR family NAD(P)-dependent oxidoreductase [Empedobacter sp. 225-1]MDM1542980.1 SDR family NAD(P)-dependent oxidoreductase [Empedobacter sp. 189-2]NOJ74629.1 SDR family NAD(P)-dependent oxidoreductase [Empedobacter stercoris]
MKRTVFITGATSGIGMATAKKLAPNYRLILCGRRQERLDEIQAELSQLTEVKTIQFDVRNKEAVFQAVESLENEWKNIDVLINNAGNAHGLAPFDSADVEDLEAMIDINVKGLIYVSKAIIPLLKQSNHAHIVNLSSIAGKEVYPNGGTYCASKAAVESLSKGMRYDLLPYGIKVSNIAPGAVETEFSLVRFKGDEEKADNVYKGFEPLQAEDIANTIEYLLQQPEHVQIADVTIFPKAQAGGTVILKK